MRLTCPKTLIIICSHLKKKGVGIVAQWVKPPVGFPTYPLRVPVLVLAALLPNHLPGMASWETQVLWVPAILGKDPDGTWGSRLVPGPILFLNNEVGPGAVA